VAAPAEHPSAAQPPTPVAVGLPITLGQFLKVAGLAATGGHAKRLIAAGDVSVNGEAELRRGRHLLAGDVVQATGVPPLLLTTDPGEV
jgi:ribosome-associated protein